MLSRVRRAARHTILLVGEGATDWAFLKYIKSLYIIRGCGVSAKVLNATVKGLIMSWITLSDSVKMRPTTGL